MKKLFLSTFIIAALFACNNTSETTDDIISDSTTVELALIGLGEFDSKAGDYIDKEVQVTGIVDHICKHGGKRLFLVSDDGDVHIESEDRFDEDIAGNNVTINGIVREFRVDESYCLKMEEETINSHDGSDEGSDEEEISKKERKMSQIEFYRDSMATAGIDHISYYSIDYVSHVINE